MIAVDTNILVYAHRQDSVWHSSARDVVTTLAEGTAPWAIPWPCIHEFLAIVTHPRIYAPPTPLTRALAQVDAWMESPSLCNIAEDPNYWQSLRPIVLAGRVEGPQIHDARVAALCARWGISELWSADRDFSRFPDVRVVNPLHST